MKKITKLSVLTLAFALFTGTLLSVAPIQANAEDDFIKDFHYTDFLKVEVGNNFTIALTTTNEVYTFGRNNLGQLGIGDNTVNESYVPNNITSRFNLNAGEKIRDIDAGLSHIVAVSTSNRIFTWGSNSHGQLGTDVLSINYTPHHRTTLNPNNLTVSKVVASELNTLVLFSNNTIRIAGSNHTGMLLNGNFTATTTVSEPNISTFRSTATVVDIGASYTTGYILLSDGRIGLWGSNGTGQLGNGNTNNSNTLVTITSVSLSLGVGEKVISVATGKNHTVAITDNQKIFFWGRNSNFAVGTAVAENNQRLSPFNISSWFYTLQLTNGDPYFGFRDEYDEEGSRPVQVYAGNDSTVFKLIMIRREYNYETETPGPITAYPEESYYEALGLNNNNGSGYILSDTSRPTLQEPAYIGFEYWDWNNSYAIHVSFSETNVAIVNNENDFTLHGSNMYGQMGLGNTTVEEDDISNYSYDFRYFEEFVYPNLPVEFAAPLDDESETLTPDQIYAIQDSIGVYFSNEYFSDKERTLVTEDQWNHMREIFAEFFENEIVYGYLADDDLFLNELLETEPETRHWYRDDLEFYVNYGSYDLSDAIEDEVILDAEIIAILDASVEARLDDFRTMISNVEAFETLLQTLLDAITVVEQTSEYDFFDFDEDVNAWLDLYDLNLEDLLTADLGDDILDVFDAYDALTDIEQMLLTEYYYWNYDELYYGYYDYFITAYVYDLDEIAAIEDSNFSQLFSMLPQIEALLAEIENLNDISFEMFTSYLDGSEEDYVYDGYEYWIYLTRVFGHLERAKPVFDTWQAIELELNFDENEEIIMDRDTAIAILDLYADFFDLGSAQYTVDGERIEYLFEVAMSYLVGEVEDALFDVWTIEDDLGYEGLFENLDDVNAAIALYENLPESALEYVDSDAFEYYEYLLSIKLPLAEALDVFNQIKAIESLDLENLDDETIETISDMYVDYLALSEEAKSLLDPEYVDWLVSLVVDNIENSINGIADSLEEFDALYNDEETREALVSSLLNAYNSYNDAPDEIKDLIDLETREQLESMYARYLELSKPKADIGMIGLILIHLIAGTYFAYKKREAIGAPSK
jgi:hypothetical protein